MKECYKNQIESERKIKNYQIFLEENKIFVEYYENIQKNDKIILK